MSSDSRKRVRHDENTPIPTNPQYKIYKFRYEDPSKPKESKKRRILKTSELTDEIRRQNQEAYDRKAPERARIAAEAAARVAKVREVAEVAMLNQVLNAIKVAGTSSSLTYISSH